VPTPSVRVTCRDTTVIVIVDMLIPPMGNVLFDRSETRLKPAADITRVA
jgi:hypothetical protein